MKILVTNDDGIQSLGIRALRQAMESIPGAAVFVVAPDRERSAAGHSITIHRPIFVNCVQQPHSEAKMWSVTGTPADCVKLAIEELIGEKPDLVVSGINHGPNLGTDVFYSGTVSAAIEASFSGIKAMAVSLASWGSEDFELAGEFSAWMAQRILDYSVPPHTLLNVNVPPVQRAQLRGAALTKLGTRRYKDISDRRTDPRGRQYYWLGGDVIEVNNDPDTDVMLIQQGYITVTPIQLDLTDHQLLRDMSGWGLEFWSGR